MLSQNSRVHSVDAAGVETGEDGSAVEPYGGSSTTHIRDTIKATLVALIWHNCSTKLARVMSYHYVQCIHLSLYSVRKHYSKEPKYMRFFLLLSIYRMYLHLS